MKYGAKNMGNILESMMGYAFISQYYQEKSLEEFEEIANYVENNIFARATEEEDEEEDEQVVNPAETNNTTE
eukprot:14809773-Heterocapsa_arctica.AAC.1